MQQHHPQQQQQIPGLISSTLSKLEQAARSAAPGLTEQVDRLLGSVGISSGTTPAQHNYYQQPAVMPPYPGASSQHCWQHYQPGPGYPAPQQQHTWSHSPSGTYAQPQQPYRPMPAPVTLVYAPATVTQVYPVPGGYPGAAGPYPYTAAGAQYGQHAWQQPNAGYQPQPYRQYQQQQQAQQRYQQQQQQQPQQPQEIPILEATVQIKPSGLPVGSRPAGATAVTAAAAATPQQQQQQVPLQQLLEQLWVSKIPAAAQGQAAAAVVGSWYHQDAGVLSEVMFMSDGRCYWNRSKSASSSDAASDTAATAGAGSSSSSAAEQQSAEIWHGVWKIQTGDAKAGKVSLMYIVEQPKQGQAGIMQQQQQQRVISYQRSALEDTLVLDGLAHIKLGAA